MTDTLDVQPEVVTAAPATCTHGNTPETCKTCRDTERKRAQRSQEKEEKAKKAKNRLPISEWQEDNRRQLGKDHREELEERQERVLDQIHWLKAQIDGTYNVTPDETDYFVNFADGMLDVQDDVNQYGVLHTLDIGAEFINEYRRNPEFRASFKNINSAWGSPIFHGENADEIWIRYGYLTAIPSNLVCGTVCMVPL